MITAIPSKSDAAASATTLSTVSPTEVNIQKVRNTSESLSKYEQGSSQKRREKLAKDNWSVEYNINFPEKVQLKREDLVCQEGLAGGSFPAFRSNICGRDFRVKKIIASVDPIAINQTQKCANTVAAAKECMASYIYKLFFSHSPDTLFTPAEKIDDKVTSARFASEIVNYQDMGVFICDNDKAFLTGEEIKKQHSVINFIQSDKTLDFLTLQRKIKDVIQKQNDLVLCPTKNLKYPHPFFLNKEDKETYKSLDADYTGLMKAICPLLKKRLQSEIKMNLLVSAIVGNVDPWNYAAENLGVVFDTEDTPHIITIDNGSTLGLVPQMAIAAQPESFLAMRKFTGFQHDLPENTDSSHFINFYSKNFNTDISKVFPFGAIIPLINDDFSAEAATCQQIYQQHLATDSLFIEKLRTIFSDHIPDFDQTIATVRVRGEKFINAYIKQLPLNTSPTP